MSNVSFSAQCSEELAAKEWGIALDAWYAKPYDVRCQMMATITGGSKIEGLMYRSMRNE